ncbi:MAG: hypothetical protein K2L59_07020 [Muribaculaceae bacterium]|nr:hypothetical protein [Muribaculaceae bacterium]
MKKKITLCTLCAVMLLSPCTAEAQFLKKLGKAVNEVSNAIGKNDKKSSRKQKESTARRSDSESADSDMNSSETGNQSYGDEYVYVSIYEDYFLTSSGEKIKPEKQFVTGIYSQDEAWPRFDNGRFMAKTEDDRAAIFDKQGKIVNNFGKGYSMAVGFKDGIGILVRTLNVALSKGMAIPGIYLRAHDFHELRYSFGDDGVTAVRDGVINDKGEYVAIFKQNEF